MSKKPVWGTKSPKKTSTALTPAQKTSAKKAAAAAEKEALKVAKEAAKATAKAIVQDATAKVKVPAKAAAVPAKAAVVPAAEAPKPVEPKKKPAAPKPVEWTCPNDGNVYPWTCNGVAYLRNFEKQIWLAEADGSCGDWVGELNDDGSIDTSKPDPYADDE